MDRCVRSVGHATIGLVAALLATSIGLSVGRPAAAVAAFPAGQPDWLYLAPAGTVLPPGIPELAGVPVGQLVFNGTVDPISQDVRSITVSTVNGPLGCNPVDLPGGGSDYAIAGCSRLTIDVAHGRLRAGTVATNLFRDDPQGNDNPADPVYRYASGAILDEFSGGVNNTSDPNSAGGFRHLEIVGTATALNATLGALVYAPDAGYRYTGPASAEAIELTLVSGDPNDIVPIAQHDVEIRVLGVGQPPTLVGPAPQQALPGAATLVPAQPVSATPPHTGAAYTINDPDADEPTDGPSTAVLLIGRLTCGAPIAAGTGFHLRGGSFVAGQPTVAALLAQHFQVASVPVAADAVAAAVAAIEAADPGATTMPLGSADPTSPTTTFAGIGTIGDVRFALSQIWFRHDAAGDQCELRTVVSDLGNNGLPLHALGAPASGAEVPRVGVAAHTLSIGVSQASEIDVSFTTPQITVTESGGSVARARVRVTPAIHPPFTIRWDAVDGSATGGHDFQPASARTLVIAQDVEFVPIDLALVQPAEDPIGTAILADSSAEGDETFSFEIRNAAFAPPPGFVVTSQVPSAFVTIVDDDAGSAGPTTVVTTVPQLPHTDSDGDPIRVLPVTGDDTRQAVELATLLVALGAVLTCAARRRERQADGGVSRPS